MSAPLQIAWLSSKDHSERNALMTSDREKRSEGLLRLFKKARGVLLDLWGTSFTNYLLLCPDLTERQPSEELLTLTLVVPIQALSPAGGGPFSPEALPLTERNPTHGKMGRTCELSILFRIF